MAVTTVLLASASPRRQALLAQIGVTCTVAAQDIDESLQPGEQASAYVRRMADEKATAALRQPESENLVVLAADTSVVCDGQVLGKPESEADALAMLELLSGREHQVLTAVSVADGEHRAQALSESVVKFRPIAEVEARQYWQTGEPRDKAGAYAIQGKGAVFVQALQGSYSGVMGLPLYETAALLNEFGIACWQAVREGRT